MKKATIFKKSRKIQTSILLTLALFICSTLSAQQKSSVSNGSKVSRTDIEFRDELKKKWIADHPSDYVQMGGKIENNANINQSQRVATTSGITDIQKESRSIKYFALPEVTSFPAFVNTGNPEKDKEMYKISKDQWISENTEMYIQLCNGNSTTRKAAKTNQNNKPNNN
jgi:hypothetical protein